MKLRILGATGLCLSLLLTGGGAVNSAPPPPPPVTRGVPATTDNVVADPAPAPDAAEVAKVRALKVGESTTLGKTALVTRTAQGLRISVNPDAAPTITTASTFCGVSLAAAIVGIGAGALGVIAAMTGGGTVVIAGYLLTGAQVGVLAGIAGSYSALLGWISTNIC